MYYKLSNNFNVKDVESKYNLTFKYPHLHKKRPIVNGLNEEILPIVLNTSSNKVDFGIWGLLPQDAKDDWSVFQEIENTLNIDSNALRTNQKHLKTLEKRRCCILVSGFFASYFHKGKIFPIYIHSNSFKTFGIAGIYNITNDGFITFSIILNPSNVYMAEHQNINKLMPVVLKYENFDKWLGKDFKKIIEEEEDDFSLLDITSHPIAREFYNNNIIYDSILEPSTSENLTIKHRR